MVVRDPFSFEIISFRYNLPKQKKQALEVNLEACLALLKSMESTFI